LVKKITVSKLLNLPNTIKFSQKIKQQSPSKMKISKEQNMRVKWENPINRSTLVHISNFGGGGDDGIPFFFPEMFHTRYLNAVLILLYV